MFYPESDIIQFGEWKEKHSEPFFQLNSSPLAMSFFSSTLSRTQSDALIEQFIQQQQRYGFTYFPLERKSDGVFLGCAGIKEIGFSSFFTPGFEIGWRLRPDFWHMGYATHAAKACIDYAFHQHKLPILWSFTAVKNIPSEKVMQRCGMQHIGYFNHPSLNAGHALALHKLYALEKISDM
jgi:RimJ/RimL family protein N-acetyltransferase